MLDRKTSTFVLWRPMKTSTPPQLIIGQFQAGNPPSLVGERQLLMRHSAAFPDLWELPAAECGLQNGQIYHYWFEIDDSDPGKNPPSRIRCADPTALTVDWRLRGPVLPAPTRTTTGIRPRSSGSRMASSPPAIPAGRSAVSRAIQPRHPSRPITGS